MKYLTTTTDHEALTGQIQAPAGTPAPATGGSPPPYPTTAPGSPNCPGPQCRAIASSGPGSPYGNGSTEGITPYTGAASSINVGVVGWMATILAFGLFAVAL